MMILKQPVISRYNSVISYDKFDDFSEIQVFLFFSIINKICSSVTLW